MMGDWMGAPNTRCRVGCGANELAFRGLLPDWGVVDGRVGAPEAADPGAAASLRWALLTCAR